MRKTLAAANRGERVPFKIPRSVQQSIPIQRVWQDGIWQVNGRFSQTWRFADINYSLASYEDQRDMFTSYCGVLNSLSETAQNVLANLITILLGLTIASRMNAAEFLRVETLLILGLGLIAFVMDTVGGVIIAKLMNLFLKEKINPMIGAAGISAFPMSARVVHKMGLAEDKQNFLLMHAAGVNVSGQIASVIAGGLILALVGG